MARTAGDRVVTTPLFPVLLPDATGPMAARSAAGRLDIVVTVAPASATAVAPSPELRCAASRPFLPEALVGRFTGREFCDPGAVEALAATGLEMAREANEHVTWTAERGTARFLRNHGEAWLDALDASGEVLLWLGEAPADGHRGNLPLVRTASVVRRSPRWLAELLMDSARVRSYNKLSVARIDEEVFQTGV